MPEGTFDHTKPGGFLMPSVRDEPQPQGVPRYRWPEGVAPEQAGLVDSSVDMQRYESFRREQKLQVDMALASAERARAANHNNASELAKAAPERADSGSITDSNGRTMRGGEAPSTVPARSQAEEAERAYAARERLISLGLGYDVRLHFLPETWMRDAGNNPVQTYAYVVSRGGYTQSITDLLGLEGFAWVTFRDARAQAAQLAQLAKQSRPLVTVSAVQVVGPDEEFKSPSEIEADALRDRLAQLERLVSGG